METEKFIWWLVCWFYMGCWVKIFNRRNWWSTSDPTMSEGDTFRINKYMPSARFEGIKGSLHYTDKNDVEYYDGLLHMR